MLICKPLPTHLQPTTQLILTYKAIYQVVTYICWGILAPQGIQVYRYIVRDLLYGTEHISLVTWGVRQCLSGGRAWWQQGYLNQHGGCNSPGAFGAPQHIWSFPPLYGSAPPSDSFL